jgi:bifunctional UDP-N-acetylglucosamine pyrophosphorylase/glucosamine-1-phosphate N-acetyltransferase
MVIAPLIAIVLAAGKGTRMHSALPKVLHPLLGKPLLARALSALDDLMLTQAYVVVGHGGDQVTAALPTFGKTYPMTPITQAPQLGTGHAVMQVASQAHIPNNATVVITYGDVPLLQPATVRQLLAFHQQQGHALTVLAAERQNPTGYGRLLHHEGQLVGVVEEKDATAEQRAIRLINTGVYVLDWAQTSPLLGQLTNQNAQGEWYLTDLVALAAQHGLKMGHTCLGAPWETDGINSRLDLQHCLSRLNTLTQHRLMSQGVTIWDPATTWIAPEVIVGPDTVIYPGCVLEGAVAMGANNVIGPHTQLVGPVTLGNDCTVRQSLVMNSRLGDRVYVGPYAQIRDGCQVANDIKIGNFVELKNATMGDWSNAAHLTYLGDVTMGHHVNMGAGTIVANYDPVRDLKHASAIADHAKVGCNSVLVAPVSIGEGACVAAGSVITNDVDAWDLAIARAKQDAKPGWVKEVMDS